MDTIGWYESRVWLAHKIGEGSIDSVYTYRKSSLPIMEMMFIGTEENFLKEADLVGKKTLVAALPGSLSKTWNISYFWITDKNKIMFYRASFSSEDVEGKPWRLYASSISFSQVVVSKSILDIIEEKVNERK